MVAKKKRAKPKPRPEHWEVFEEHEHGASVLERGTEFTFKESYGLRRRARFIEKIHNTKNGTVWITCSELAPDSGGYIVARVRSIDPDAILRVWKKTKKAATRKQRLKEKRESNGSH